MSFIPEGERSFDTREAQAVRVADYLDSHPESMQKEIDAACDTGCISKVLSEMPRLGYRVKKGWREVSCNTGNRRRVRTYSLIQRPGIQPDLFQNS